MKKNEYAGLTHLGEKSALPASPDDAKLDCVPNPHPDCRYAVRFSCPEFTSLCPVTGQPDYARLVIDYVPDMFLLESKSLKLFMSSFRNHGDFHEGCTIYIAKRIIEAVKPNWLRIGGYWYPRGGIPIDVFYQTDPQPAGLYVPPVDIPVYGAR